MRRKLLFRIIMLLSSAFLLFANLSCERRKEEKSKTNSPPVITSVIVLPEKLNKESELNLSVQSKDLEGDSVTYQYQWIKNEEEINGANGSSLKSGNFKKGDILRVRVTPSDGKVSGTPFLSAPVKILNAPPVVLEVWIEPKVAYVTDPLKANVKSSDLDGDFIYYTYHWEKNGVVLNEERGEILERGQFRKGDSIAINVTPDDRETLGSPKKSQVLVISNSPPIILSTPPTSVEKTSYIYEVRAIDPDKDPLTFSLKSGPKEMEMDKNTGLIRWEIRKEDKGNHPIEIGVSDDGGARSSQRYTLIVDFR
jgi:Putative Ig domain